MIRDLISSESILLSKSVGLVCRQAQIHIERICSGQYEALSRTKQPFGLKVVLCKACRTCATETPS